MSSKESSNTAVGQDIPSDDYKLVIYRSEDFKEVRSFNLSLGNIYVITSVVFLILSGLLFSLMAFTPLKHLIPGYGKIESNNQFLQLVDGVDDLSHQIEAQSTYIGALRTLLGTGLADPEIGNLPDLVVEAAIANPRTSSTVVSRNNEQVQAAKANDALQDVKDVSLYTTIENNQVFYPVSGLVSSQFEPSIKHFGVDILAPAKTPVMAMMDGIVFSSGWDIETGYSLGIQHADNILSFYKHNSLLLKEKGTFVRAGEAVAIIGNTGTMSSGPHLHFEIWHKGQPINPEDILKFN